MAWIAHVKDGQSGTIVLFDIKNRSAIIGVVEKHCIAGLPRQFGKIRGWYENDIVGRLGLQGRHNHDATCNYCQCRSAKMLRYLTACVFSHLTICNKFS
jgi:hypothetical protein